MERAQYMFLPAGRDFQQSFSFDEVGEAMRATNVLFQAQT